jgi:hypothetical protein
MAGVIVILLPAAPGTLHSFDNAIETVPSFKRTTKPFLLDLG